MKSHNLGTAPLHLGNIFPDEGGDFTLVVIDNYGDRITLAVPRGKTMKEIELKISEILKTENWDWAGAPPD